MGVHSLLLRWKIATLVFTIFSGLLILDFILCLVLIKPVKKLRAESEAYHHGLSPNQRDFRLVEGLRLVKVSTNSLGFRDRTNSEIDLAAKSNRLLLIGDSFTEGIGVEYEQSFAGILNERLSKIGIEVLNASAASYSPIIYYFKLKDLIENRGLRFDYLAVFLDISDIQDELFYELNSANKIFYNQKGLDYLREVNEMGVTMTKDWAPLFFESQKFYFVGSIYRWFLRSQLPSFERPLIDKFNFNMERSRWTFDPQLRKKFEPGLKKATHYLDELVKLAKKNGVKKVFLVIYPWPDQIMAGDYPSLQQIYWKKWADDKGVVLLDLFPLFIPRKVSEAERLSTYRTYYELFDFHWNSAGHRVVSENLFETFKKLK